MTVLTSLTVGVINPEQKELAKEVAAVLTMER